MIPKRLSNSARCRPFVRPKNSWKETTKIPDRIVEEVHAVRQKTCMECGFDFDKRGEYYMRLKREYPSNLIEEVPMTELDLKLSDNT